MRELLLRLLSDSPEARGTAPALAQALEAAADGRTEVALLPESRRPLMRERAFMPWLALAATGGAAVLLWTLQAANRHEASDSHLPEASTSALGDTSPTAPLASGSNQTAVSQDTALQPRPGQALPDGKGRCPMPKQVPLNGACWLEISSVTSEECTQSGCDYVKGKCYCPALSPPQKTLPTSGPAEAR
jgi:hypothetical protein